LASETVIKQIPRLLGPGLNKAGKFPTLVSHNESLEGKVPSPNLSSVERKEKKRLRLSASIYLKPSIIPGCPLSSVHFLWLLLTGVALCSAQLKCHGGGDSGCNLFCPAEMTWELYEVTAGAVSRLSTSTYVLHCYKEHIVPIAPSELHPCECKGSC